MDSIFQHKWCHLLCNTFVSQKICKTYFLLWRNSFLSLIKVVLRFRPICHEWLHWEGDKILPPPPAYELFWSWLVFLFQWPQTLLFFCLLTMCKEIYSEIERLYTVREVFFHLLLPKTFIKNSVKLKTKFLNLW